MFSWGDRITPHRAPLTGSTLSAGVGDPFATTKSKQSFSLATHRRGKAPQYLGIWWVSEEGHYCPQAAGCCTVAYGKTVGHSAPWLHHPDAEEHHR